MSSLIWKSISACTPLDVLVIEQPELSVILVAYKFGKAKQDLLDEARESFEKKSQHMKKYTN